MWVQVRQPGCRTTVPGGRKFHPPMCKAKALSKVCGRRTASYPMDGGSLFFSSRRSRTQSEVRPSRSHCFACPEGCLC
jgi:hypothetical protein